MSYIITDPIGRTWQDKHGWMFGYATVYDTYDTATNALLWLSDTGKLENAGTTIEEIDYRMAREYRRAAREL